MTTRQRNAYPKPKLVIDPDETLALARRSAIRRHHNQRRHNDRISKYFFIPTDRCPHRVLRIAPDTAHIFSMKERTPYLLILELEDLDPPPPPPTRWTQGNAGDNPFESGPGIPSQPQQHAGTSSPATGPATAGAHASASKKTTGDGTSGCIRPGGPRRLGRTQNAKPKPPVRPYETLSLRPNPSRLHSQHIHTPPSPQPARTPRNHSQYNQQQAHRRDALRKQGVQTRDACAEVKKTEEQLKR